MDDPEFHMLIQAVLAVANGYRRMSMRLAQMEEMLAESGGGSRRSAIIPTPCHG
jgi:hypothetical protein